MHCQLCFVHVSQSDVPKWILFCCFIHFTKTDGIMILFYDVDTDFPISDFVFPMIESEIIL